MTGRCGGGAKNNTTIQQSYDCHDEDADGLAQMRPADPQIASYTAAMNG